MPPAKTARRTQEERSATTRAALLDATVDCLIELGYHGTTTARVAERAGLSRGAHLHHFQTRAALVAAAVDHLSVRRADEWVREVEAMSQGPDRVREGLDLMWRLYSGPLFMAAVDLSAAARTDPELRAQLAPVERVLNRRTIQLCAQLFVEQAERPDFTRLLEHALATIRGLAMMRMLQPRRGELDTQWQYSRARLVELFEAPPPV